MKTNQKGFTLVEIAIVLVIIGLLLGGVMKGQELIAGTKVKALKKNFDEISTAFYTYQDKYNALPGDDKKANKHVGVTAETQEGDGDGLIEGAYDSTTAGDESSLMWLHLREAGLISGSGQEQPNSAYGTVLGVSATSPDGDDITLAGNLLCAASVPLDAALDFDTKYDDGVFNTGSIQASATYTSGTDPVIVCKEL